MTWMQLMSLYIVYINHRSLGMDTYNITAGQLADNVISTNLTINSFEENSQEKQQTNLTASTEKLQTKASVARILYLTNRTADFTKKIHDTGSRNVSTPVTEDQRILSGFGWNSRGYKPLGQTFNRRSATKPSFQTSRGKNWCAYVHTRLSPTVVIDSVSSYVPIATDPCYWSRGGCHERYQTMSRPTYRIKHKIVTSLEWRCCPGYIGPQCQLKDTSTQTQLSDEGAKAHSESRTTRKTAPEGQQQATEPAKQLKMDNAINNEANKMTTLLKKVDNMSRGMDTMKTVLFSLEEKMIEEKGNDLPSIMRALKTKAIQELFRDIVQEQVKASQNAMQKSIANILKNLFSVSEEVEATKDNLKQLNETMTSLVLSLSLMQENNKHMVNDIQNLKVQVSSLQGDISVIQTNITTELNDKYGSLKDNLALEKQEKMIFVNTLNHTFSQIKEIHSQLLDGKSVYGLTVNDSNGKKNHNLTQRVSLLGDAVRKQVLITLQLQQDLQTQELRLGNLTTAVGRQRQLAAMTSETMAVQCKQDLLPQLQEIKDSISTVNQTLCDKVKPMGDMMNAIEEKISHVSYDLEELKPIIEKDGFAGVACNEEKQPAELSVVKARVESLASVINSLNVSIADLEKAQEELSNQTKAKEEEVQEQLKGCRDGIEDALNDTVTIINKAIDAVNDNHYILENNLESTNQQLSEMYNEFTENVKRSSDLIPYIHFLNSTVLDLQNKIERFDDDLSLLDRHSESMNRTNEMNGPQNLTHLSQQLKEAVSKLEDHQAIIERLQGTPSNASNDFIKQKMHLKHLESRINALGYNSTSVVRPKKKPPAEMGLAWKYKDLNKRVQDLAIKMFNLTTEVLLLKESDQNVWDLCQNMSISLDQQARIPQVIQEHINFTLLKKGLNEFLQPESHILCESALMDPTAYLNCALTSIFKDVSVLQRHANELDRRLDATVVLNASSVFVGRSQRNTDNIVEQVESQDCSHSPCQNGGTCINVQNGYVCACRSPFGGTNCTVKLVDNMLSPDLSKGSYRYAPMVTFFVAHTFTMSAPGPIRFNHLYVNYGTSYSPGSGKFSIPYLGVYVFKYTIESSSSTFSGYLVVDGVDKLAFQSQGSSSQDSGGRVVTGDAVLELNFGQRVWLRLDTGSIPARYPPVTTFGGYLLYCT